jgi:hypothetical protein
MAEHTFGYPPIVRVSQTGTVGQPLETTSTAVLWPNLLFVLAAGYAAAIPLGRWITGYRTSTGEFIGPHYTGRRAPAAVIVQVVLIGFALAAFLTPLMRRFAQTETSDSEITWGLGMTWIALAVPITVMVMMIRRLLYRRRNPTGRGFQIQPAGRPAETSA